MGQGLQSKPTVRRREWFGSKMEQSIPHVCFPTFCVTHPTQGLYDFLFSGILIQLELHPGGLCIYVHTELYFVSANTEMANNVPGKADHFPKSDRIDASGIIQ